MNRNKFENILLWIIKIGLFATVFVPLIFSSKLFFPFIVMKDVAFRVIIEIIFFTYILLLVGNKKFLPKLNFFTISVIAYFAIMTITSFAGIDLYSSIWGNYERMGGLFRMWHVFAYFIILISVFREEKYWNSFFSLSILASTFMSFFTIAQKMNVPFLLPSSGGDRLTGTIGNAIYLAAYILFNIFFIAYFFLKDKKFDLKAYFFGVLGADALLILYDLYMLSQGAPASILRQLGDSTNFFAIIIIFHITLVVIWIFREMPGFIKIFLSILFVCEMAILFWTQTRGALVGLYLGLFITMVAGAILYKLYRKFFLTGVIILLIAPVLLFLFRGTSIVQSIPILNRVASISLFSPDDITTQSRILTWTASVRGWTENSERFLFGYGLENYYYVFNKNYPSQIYRDPGSQVWFDRAHNIVLDVGISTGVFGLVAYLSIFALAILILFFYSKSEKKIVLFLVFSSLLITYFFQNFFVFDTMDSYIQFYSVLGFVAFVSYALSEKHFFTKIYFTPKNSAAPDERNLNTDAYQAIFVIVCASLVVCIYLFNIRLVAANTVLYKAVRASMEAPDKYKKNLEFFQRAIDTAVTGKYEARQQLLDYVVKMKKATLPKEELKKMVEKTEAEFKKSIQESPLEVRHYLMITMLYNEYSGLIPSYAQKAIEYGKLALELSPTRSQIYFAMGQAYFGLGQKEAAVQSFEKGVGFAPYAEGLHIMMADVYSGAGLTKKTENELDYIVSNYNKVGAAEDDMKHVIDLYERIGKYDKMIQVLDDLARIFPDTAKVGIYMKSAYAYAYKGDVKRAEEFAKKALEFDPGSKEAVQKFLNDLRENKFKK